MSDVLPIIEFITQVLILIGVVVTAKVGHKIHVLVNSKFTAKLGRIEELTEALVGADVSVPEDRSDV